MHRYVAVSFLCSLLAGGLLGAPAPFHRETGAWYNGWDRPLDAVGGCKFDRHGDKLTITVPGKPHALNVREGRLDAPHLLRNVEGDFDVPGPGKRTLRA